MGFNTEVVPGMIIADFCQRWKIRELALFGPMLGGEFIASSDIDLLVTFDDDARWGLLEHVQMEKELEQLFGRKVDLITKRAAEQSHNWIRRKAILDSARIFYPPPLP